MDRTHRIFWVPRSVRRDGMDGCDRPYGNDRRNGISPAYDDDVGTRRTVHRQHERSVPIPSQLVDVHHNTRSEISSCMERSALGGSWPDENLDIAGWKFLDNATDRCVRNVRCLGRRQVDCGDNGFDYLEIIGWYLMDIRHVTDGDRTHWTRMEWVVVGGCERRRHLLVTRRTHMDSQVIG